MSARDQNPIIEKNIENLKLLHDRNVCMGIPQTGHEFNATLLAALTEIKSELAVLRAEVGKLRAKNFWDAVEREPYKSPIIEPNTAAEVRR